MLIVVRWVLPAVLSATGNPYLAGIGQYLNSDMGIVVAAPLAFACGAAALLSAINGRERRRLIERQTSLDTLRDLSWRELESLVAGTYQRLGYRVAVRGGAQADGGVDLELRRDGNLTLVQCKQWRSREVGVATVREQYGLMHHHQAAAIIIVTTGRFTSEARAFALDKPIDLVGGEALLNLVKGVQRENGATTIPSAPTATAPKCPLCSGEMIERTARRTGARFLGCAKFPACRGTRTL